jgi:hypothetical protein
MLVVVMAAELVCFDRNVGGGELGQMMMRLVMVMVAVLELQVMTLLT